MMTPFAHEQKIRRAVVAAIAIAVMCVRSAMHVRKRAFTARAFADLSVPSSVLLFCGESLSSFSKPGHDLIPPLQVMPNKKDSRPKKQTSPDVSSSSRESQ